MLAFAPAASSENEVPLWHNTSTRICTTRGYVWPDIQITSRLSSLENSDDFACACVYVEFRLHLQRFRPFCKVADKFVKAPDVMICSAPPGEFRAFKTRAT